MIGLVGFSWGTEWVEQSKNPGPRLPEWHLGALVTMKNSGFHFHNGAWDWP
jgi:hypothetical protein